MNQGSIGGDFSKVSGLLHVLYIYTYIYLYNFWEFVPGTPPLSRARPSAPQQYLYVHVYVCMYVCMYIHVTS
jgi:hypothetical protein